ncbi:hypothetical protein [Pseudoalteromonas xiamenensis]|uniref:Uncharacterized protein n=1 Tax=Pseudoalteromonas xiamenensis TaxID=882626 RepID=A0A975HLU7_9GAMM|nr:hypothetical protein [Pseudoalteromonas xiamenensis]QTH72297.1 hypothetical protein J5O05_05360 [Pseudoalteromonas xiamenensis]
MLTKMGDDAEELTKQLRCQKNGLKTMHEICDKFGYPVTISYKKTNGDRLELIRIDRSTITNMVPKVGKEEKTIFAGITRFNIHTGNGRLLLKGDEETVSFGFGLKFKDMAHKIKKVFTENLNLNNGVSSESYINLKLVVNEVQRNDGAIIKYIVRAVYIDA